MDAQQEQILMIKRAVLETVIATEGIYVTEVSGLGHVIMDRPLDPDEQMMLAEFTEQLRIKRKSNTKGENK